MAAPTPLTLPRDCYSIGQLRRLMGHRDDEGRLVPLSRQAVHARRIKGTISFIKFGGSYFFPRGDIDAMIQKANDEAHRPTL